MKVFHSGLWILVILLASLAGEESGEKQLPLFGRDTVLVWKIKNLDYESQFVARIAEFSPDRFMEWEEVIGQGTIFMPSRDLLTAKNYVDTDLFKSGINSQSKQATTLWLSRLIYRDLKNKKKIKCNLDGVPAFMTYTGDARLAVEVNKSMQELPVIKVEDDRGSERWFLDNEENPLLMKHVDRKYSKTLTGITTNRSNTLRWIKGDKRTIPPR
jgi:hypothetical protein